MNKITSFKQIKEIIEPIPADKFQTYFYGFTFGAKICDNDKSCFLGHIHRHFNPEDVEARGDGNGYGAKQLTQQFLHEVHDLGEYSGASVNDRPNINGYTEPVIKDRLMHMIEDGIKWEQSKESLKQNSNEDNL